MRSLPLWLVLAWSVPAWAVPLTFTQQGRLLDDQGQPLQAVGSLSFSLFDAATGGTALWTEAHQPALDAGYYSVRLGDTTPLDASLLAGDRWLGITVDGVALDARVPLDSVPFAVLASRSDEADHAATATTADSATTAAHATTADSATSATHAATADSATTATSATSAGHATSADSATTADRATKADSATTAGHATTADSADSATTAGHADDADESDHAASATLAGGLVAGAALDVDSVTAGGHVVIASDGTIDRAWVSGLGTSLDDLGCGQDGDVPTFGGGDWACGAPPTAVTRVEAGAGLTGGPITSTGTLSIASGGVVPSMLASNPAGLAAVSGGKVSVTASGGLRVGNTIWGAWTASVPYTFNGAGYATDKLQMKTALTCGNGQGQSYMWNIEFVGHDFRGNTPFRVISVGYSQSSYPDEIQNLGTVVDYGSLLVTPYCSTDDFLSFELDLNRGGADRWHASDLTVNLLHGGSGYEKNASDGFAVTAAREGARY